MEPPWLVSFAGCFWARVDRSFVTVLAFIQDFQKRFLGFSEILRQISYIHRPPNRSKSRAPLKMYWTPFLSIWGSRYIQNAEPISIGTMRVGRPRQQSLGYPVKRFMIGEVTRYMTVINFRTQTLHVWHIYLH